MFFSNLFARLTPAVKADDELVDPQTVLREKCRETHAKNYAIKYDECNARVRSKKHTTETCIEELYDLMHAVDNCVAKELFSKLK